MRSLTNLQRLFILICMFAVLTAQKPSRKYVDSSAIDWIDFGIMRFGHFAGLDNTWEMFSYAHRDYYRLIFLGEKPNEKNILLQLPNQSKLDFSWRWFFNFREEKFLLNIYGKEKPLDAYINYLCRHAGGGPYLKIRIQVEKFHIVSRNEAAESGLALAPSSPYLMREGLCLN
jgi:hypothetical protein